MDKAELLSEFESRVDKFEKFQSFIEKAKSQAGKFAAAVVDKVIADNREKSMEVVGEIIPFMADMEAVMEQLEVERVTAQESAKDSTFKLEELELRHMIGDLTDEAFEAEATEFRTVVESTAVTVTGIDEELKKFHGAIDRWQELGREAGVLEAGGEDEQDIVVEEIDAGELEGFDDADDAGSHAESVSISEDMSVVFEEEEASDGFDVGDLDILGDDEEIELEAGDDEDEEDDKPRRAVREPARLPPRAPRNLRRARDEPAAPWASTFCATHRAYVPHSART